MEETWPGDQGTDPVEAQAEDEDRLVAVMTKNPICMAKRGERISTFWRVSVAPSLSFKNQCPYQNRPPVTRLTELWRCQACSGNACSGYQGVRRRNPVDKRISLLSICLSGVERFAHPEEEQYGNET